MCLLAIDEEARHVIAHEPDERGKGLDLRKRRERRGDVRSRGEMRVAEGREAVGSEGSQKLYLEGRAEDDEEIGFFEIGLGALEEALGQRLAEAARSRTQSGVSSGACGAEGLKKSSARAAAPPSSIHPISGSRAQDDIRLDEPSVPLGHREPPALAVLAVGDGRPHLLNGHALASLNARAAVKVAVRRHDHLARHRRRRLERVDVLREASLEHAACMQLHQEVVRGRRREIVGPELGAEAVEGVGALAKVG